MLCTVADYPETELFGALRAEANGVLAQALLWNLRAASGDRERQENDSVVQVHTMELGTRPTGSSLVNHRISGDF